MLRIVLLEAGVQGGQVSNQTRIYSLSPELHNRVNTIHIVTYFIGGSLRSTLGAWACSAGTGPESQPFDWGF